MPISSSSNTSGIRPAVPLLITTAWARRRLKPGLPRPSAAEPDHETDVFGAVFVFGWRECVTDRCPALVGSDPVGQLGGQHPRLAVGVAPRSGVAIYRGRVFE